jgi:hypothetical protein
MVVATTQLRMRGICGACPIPLAAQTAARSGGSHDLTARGRSQHDEEERTISVQKDTEGYGLGFLGLRVIRVVRV